MNCVVSSLTMPMDTPTIQSQWKTINLQAVTKKIEYLTFSYIYTSVFAFSRLSLLWCFMSSFESWYGSSMARFGSSILGSALLLQQFRNPRDESTPPFRGRMPSQRRKNRTIKNLKICGLDILSVGEAENWKHVHLIWIMTLVIS